MKVVTAAQMHALDRRAMTDAGISGSTLMSHAGTGVVETMAQVFGSLTDKAITVMCGKGNNGGDGFVIAKLLRSHGARVHVSLMAKVTDLRGDARVMYRRFMTAGSRSTVHVSPDDKEIRLMVRNSDCVVDAILGTGLSSPVTGSYRRAIEAINEISFDFRLPVISVDLPSGLHADSGAVLGAAVNASLTVTFGLPKLGLYIGHGIDHAGDIRIIDIGIPKEYANAIESTITLLTPEEMLRLLPMRIRSAHKGTFGHAGIIAGSVGKTGAAALTAHAALRVGAGLVTVATPAGVNATLEGKLLEAMTMPMPETDAQTLSISALDHLMTFVNNRSAIAIGPGLSTHPETAELIRSLIVRSDKPSVLDADALNAVAGHTELLDECKVPPILTPHPGEMARLGKGIDALHVNDDRIGTATRFAQKHGVILVLKGARTVIAKPDGHVAICPTGNPGMATAGTGDALTGMIVGLLAQKLNSWEAACAGTYLHGLAGDLAAAELGLAGMTAGDLITRIPYAITQLTTKQASNPRTRHLH